jgi:hypothetical protein
MWLGGNAPEDLALCLAELLDANYFRGNVDVALCVMSVTPVAKTPRGVMSSLWHVVNQLPISLVARLVRLQWDKCRERISPIPVKGSAIQARRMVVHFRG